MIRVVFAIFLIAGLFACSQKVVPTNDQIETVTNKAEEVEIEAIMIELASTFVGPCEPSIAIDPNNPMRMVAGSVLNNVYISNDGGKNWQVNKLSSCLLYTSPSPRDQRGSRMPSSA